MTTSAPLRLALYRLAAKLAGALPFRGKLAESLAGRRDSLAFWSAHGRPHGSRNHVIWFHAASVGEALVAEPVVRRIRTAVTDIQIVFTWSSPSVREWQDVLKADLAHFAPPESPRGAATVFDAIRPDLLAFSRSDLWPEMLIAASERNVPIAVIGGAVRPGSARLHWPVRSFLRRLYRDIRFVGAVTAEDAERWIALGAPENAVTITGDPRHDQVLEQITDLVALRPLRSWAEAGPPLVAGSIEPEDESILVAAFALVLNAVPEARLLIVPHDPTAETTQRITDTARHAGIVVRMMEEPLASATRCVISTSRGLLASLYSLGRLSYVGGGFRPGSLHAVIEPAAFGIPVIVGPEFAWSTDARTMVSAGGAVALTRHGGVQELASSWIRWLRNNGELERAGIAARMVLSQGAAGRTARRLVSLLSRS